MKILITGGAGFIGSGLAEKLSRQGYEVTILDSLNPQVHGENPEIESDSYALALNSCRNFVKGCITDAEAVEAAVKEVDVVVNLAAETGTAQSMYECHRHIHANVSGASALVSALRSTGAGKLGVIHASTRAVYGEGCYVEGGSVCVEVERTAENLERGRYEPTCKRSGRVASPAATPETANTRPLSVYGVTKLAQEQLLSNFTQQTGRPFVSLRLQNVYGPRQSLRNPYTGLMTVFANKARLGLPITIFEDGRATRDFVYIDDVVDAFANAVSYLPKRGAELINVGTGRGIDIISVAELIMKELNSYVPLEVLHEARIGDIRHNFADITVARSALGWAPKVSFEAGVRKMCEWMKEMPLPKDTFNSTLTELRAAGQTIAARS